MMEFIYELAFPGFMCVPSETWTFRNEFHTIIYSMTGIIFGVKIIKVKDVPSELPVESILIKEIILASYFG